MATPFSLTQAILISDPLAYKSATQSPFLAHAAQGRLSKSVLGQWLANDRLYIHAYIRGVGRLLSFLQLPEVVIPPRDEAAERKYSPNEKLLHWMIDALVNIRREEDFFVRTAGKYGIDVNLPAGADGCVAASSKLEGLRRFEALFDGISPNSDEGVLLPWLEAAIIFWATEKCYLDAWSGAAARLSTPSDSEEDADGGALRREFIPNWSSKEFAQFVDQLGEIIDSAVQREMELRRDADEVVKTVLLDRALAKWHEVLAAENAFWPAMEA
ncbi:uncharacterized protein TRIVIDRAFT_146702 [Trichoderma virens Gv29-8]|uniref:Thiaminase-2/PQQC domain-containing protein n=1 Tax=Hypocrea virens (strain Gv29-8 / FGSC 10586) TaxID=413071 RepID=G9MLY4_HYPVG|nr:uncharacterized protein TRIVIDRAFT_146702 [Trichoderma virens Gv29-8]EHK24357.1 hypothetical protein TRIVIDRAFT_146702 [Trichoderma virens Gv29-8]UKZ54624.1 hypothetical protein TrVGV298_008434 [Trichoderma virens]